MDVIKVKDIILWANDEGYVFDYYGDTEIELEGFSSLTNYKKETLTWINTKNHIDQNTIREIKCAVLQRGVIDFPSNYFVTERSKEFFFDIIKHFFNDCKELVANGVNTFIGPNVIFGNNVSIGCNCVLDGNISIGDNTIIEHGVIILNSVRIGSDCIIHSGVIIGKDGFGFSFDNNNIPKKVPHFGGVKIGDRVEIGGNSTIDRGTIDDTLIGDDVKIDSLVLVAHNASIGNGTLVLSGCDIAGSSVIGEKTYIAPHAVIKNKVVIGDNSFVGMSVVVDNSVGDDSFIVHGDNRIRKNKNYRRFL